jgi:hypothetical protein
LLGCHVACDSESPIAQDHFAQSLAQGFIVLITDLITDPITDPPRVLQESGMNQDFGEEIGA